ncbi:TetR/AcrR family transcriptional regulator [Ferrimonas futtsuensis]|uniref:TetR/AcrR family transcriptional regulator n=1 Tax=Ferrimonas futtsuensis TaxID=364764 RepID=UPI0004062857|nr:TetR/AcrR family transcriptional regulator [Ferrimonas futtsuensis]
MNTRVNRSKKRIMQAFQTLLNDKDYCDITVTEIIEQADVGKTTFYRHYERKLDIFYELHRLFFARLLSSYDQAEQWLSPVPSDAVVRLLAFFSNESGFRRSLTYKLGNDWSQASRQLKQDLAAQIETQLTEVFGAERFDMALTDLSGALAALFIEFIGQAVNGPKQTGMEEKAANLQRLIRAQVTAALNP